MKVAVVLVAILGCSNALPSLDWSKIEPNYAYVNPVSNLSVPVLPRIVGGREVVPNSKPYQVALIIDGAHFCGGVLISSTFVLTAGHCVEGRAYIQIILGAHNIREIESTQIVITSTNINVHPDYNRLNLNNDIALIRFPNAITFNNNIRPVALASASAGSFVDYEGTLTGWGRLSDAQTSIASTLHAVDVTIMANFWCSRTYGTSVIIDSTICTSGVGAVGGCDGDSGSPLVVETALVGVASFVAQTGCQQGLPTGYARITSFLSWIIQNSDLEA
ncbi:brachyurin [Anoplophora glabripennis]|nr:brachyurin [Anoplophora glabripennis]